MAFRLAHFEEQFDEITLRRALRLRSAVTGVRRSAGEQHVQVGKHEVFLKLRGGLVQKAGCSCGKKACEHLAAVLLNLLNADVSHARTSRSMASKKQDPFHHIFSKQNPRLQESAVAGQKRGAKKTLHQLLERYLIITHQLSLGEGEREAFLKELAGIRESLEKQFRRGLSREDQQLWYNASLAILRNNRLLQAHTFYFILLRLMTISLRPVEVHELYLRLVNRRYKKPFEEPFNAFGVIALLFEKKYGKAVGNWHQNSYEGLIHKAELQFVQGKANTAFNALFRKAEQVSLEDKALYLHLLQYMLARAQLFSAEEIEKQILLMLVEASHIVHPQWLSRLKHLSGKEFPQLMAPLAEAISRINAEKYIQLMRATGKNKQLLLEMLGDNTSRFSLLNELAVELHKDFDDRMLRLYAVRLAKLLVQNGYSSGEELVLRSAGGFLKQIGRTQREKVFMILAETISPGTPAGRAVAAMQLQISPPGETMLP